MEKGPKMSRERLENGAFTRRLKASRCDEVLRRGAALCHVRVSVPIARTHTSSSSASYRVNPPSFRRDSAPPDDGVATPFLVAPSCGILAYGGAATCASWSVHALLYAARMSVSLLCMYGHACVCA